MSEQLLSGAKMETEVGMTNTEPFLKLDTLTLPNPQKKRVFDDAHGELNSVWMNDKGALTKDNPPQWNGDSGSHYIAVAGYIKSYDGGEKLEGSTVKLNKEKFKAPAVLCRWIIRLK
jgi:hypothetical protein